jgi:predicted RNA-binding Zn ribbon-like protein
MPSTTTQEPQTTSVAQMRDTRSRDGTGFQFGTGSLALDLVATLRQHGSNTVDLLDGPERLGEWLRGPGLPIPAGGLTDEDVTTASTLRGAIDAIARALVAGRPPDPSYVRHINAFAKNATPVFLLRTDGCSQVAVEEPDTTATMSVVARDAIRVFAGADAQRLRECAREGCSTLFFDRSPSGRRRWCSMKGCGEIVASASYRLRRQEGSGR